MQVHTIGLDLAKNIFQVQGVDRQDEVVVTRKLRRGQVIEFFQKLPSCLGTIRISVQGPVSLCEFETAFKEDVEFAQMRWISRTLMPRAYIDTILSSCLFQLVQQAIRSEGGLRIGAGQQLVKDGVWNSRLFASCHRMSPS
jgi:hypothetical protein